MNIEFDQFKESLSFLEDYGFQFSSTKYKDHRPCYWNKYGEVACHYIKEAPNDYILEVYVSINGWKHPINLEMKWKFFQRASSYWKRLEKAIWKQIKRNHSIFGLKIECKHYER